MQRRHWFLSAAFVSMTVGSLAACNGDDDGVVATDAGATDAPADHTATHDTGTPQTDANVPDANVPDTNVPDTNVNAPDTYAPDTNAPDTNAPDTNAPDTGAHDANVPDTNVPDTNVPDTNVPDTNVPDTNVPDTNVPDTSTIDASADASSACLSGDAGYAIVPEDWNFAVSMNTNNGGKGQVITIKRCDSVLWTNTDTAPHSVVSTGGGFTFSTAQHGLGPYAPIQFTKAGTFTYECGVHGAMMIGQITVQ